MMRGEGKSISLLMTTPFGGEQRKYPSYRMLTTHPSLVMSIPASFLKVKLNDSNSP